ncbi:MAG: hypothetical protein MJK07_15805 [Flavobacteriales bacterium]|nr:hypothetical protein [Flavobacteriales bacterium]PHR36947.1 MAG: hypothetical protein COA38_01045 [Fluviicola sp.]
MKLILTISFMFAMGVSIGQTQQTPTTQQSNAQLFAQCMFDIPNQAELDQLTFDIYTNHPDVEMVRLDLNTQRAFVVTTGSLPLSESDFISWFDQYSGTVNCVQVGVYGVDAMNPYPFTNCSQ